MLRSLIVQEAPFDWLVRRNIKLYRALLDVLASSAICSFAMIACGACLMANHPLGNFGGSFGRFGAVLLTGAIVTGCSAYAARVPHFTHASLEVLTLVTLIIVAALCQAAPVVIVETTPRARAHVSLTLAFKAVPVVFGLRMKVCICYAVTCFFFELLGCFANARIYHDYFGWHYFGILATLHAMYLAISRQQHVSLRALYDSEQQCYAEKCAAESLAQQLKNEKLAAEALLVQLQDERAMLESLLGMVCDASLWLSSEGGVVVHSNQRLDALVGCSMAGIPLSSIIIESERARFIAALENASSSTVHLLPTSLLRPGSNVKVDFEIFIVRRKQSRPTDSSLGYLLGLRLLGAVDDAPSVEPGQDQARTLPVSTGVSSARAFSMSSGTGDSELEPAFRTMQRFGTDGVARFQGLPAHEPFQESNPYLAHCVQSVVVDLAGSMNFRVDACCAWHSALNRLLDVLIGASHWHRCEEAWRPPVAWQCSNCSALVPPELLVDRCWICSESHVQDDM
eukprot:CAMPEP_0117486744 /NCGR_PEP_ID=MMETSP0784-20121206/15635_1 /TAXON_ID=39447 /ORGANISM="" /LENGTH=511 /DNA_ID=CAMNT_0005281365 /DNA_START=119 /DNA_END=1654 /DNA_ORIENTATION=+